MEPVTFLITSNVNTFVTERRFPRDISVKDLKSKLELLTGASAASMTLELCNKENDFVACLDDPEALLNKYELGDEMKIKVVDPSLLAGEFEDLSKVEKFELSDDAYSKRQESLRAFKQQQKLGRFNEEQEVDLEAKRLEKLQLDEESAKNITVNARCEVKLLGQPTRRGTVMFIGEAEFQPGLWVGIRYDEPHGKNDGSVKGKRYFECLPKYGGFVQPRFVTAGDFPVEDDIDEEL